MLGFLFSPYGRISRKVYWLNWILPYIGISIVATGLDYAVFPINPETQEPPPVFEAIAGLILLWPSLAVTTKRLHDRGMTGWWNAAPFLAVVALGVAGYVYMTAKMAGQSVPFGRDPASAAVVLIAGATLAWLFLYPLINTLFLRGQAGQNTYGPDPLGDPAAEF